MLVVKGAGVDDGVCVQIAATPAETGGGSVTVQAQVAHHLDGSCPKPGAGVALDSTCLAGGPSTELPDFDTIGEAYPGPDAVGSDDAEADWRRTEPTMEEVALRDAVDDDP